MKKASIFLMILCAVSVAANGIMFFSFGSKLDNLNSKLDQVEAQLTGVLISVNRLNNMQISTGEKEKEVFSPLELAQYLDVEMSKVYDMIDAPGVGLPYVCIDGEYRFGKEAIDEWLR